MAASAEPASAGSEDVVRLAQLATPLPLVLRGAADPQERSFAYRLPANASQGPERWYTIRLRFRITFARSSGAGFAWVLADTNGRTSAQIEFTTQRVRGRLRIRRTSVDLLHGQREDVFWSRTSEMTYTNYLQYAGVIEGENILTLRLEQTGGTKVESLAIYGDTAIVRTDRSPFPLTLDARLLEESVHVGDTFQVAVTLRNRIGNKLRNVVVQPSYDAKVLEVASPVPLRYPRLGRRVEGLFAFRALRAGTHQLGLLVDSNRNDPSLTVAIRVGPERTSGLPRAIVSGGVLLPIIVGGAWLVRARRRR